jgi:hypothetical protein
MNKLLVTLLASAFALGSASALAQTGGKTFAVTGDNDMKPLSKMETDEAKAARAQAKAHWAKMTPEEQAAARKATRAKRQSELTALDEMANPNMQYNAKEGAADAAASKAQPVPTKQERQQYGTTMDKKASSGQ